MLKVYFRHKGKIDFLIMEYTESDKEIINHVTEMFPNASVVRSFMYRG